MQWRKLPEFAEITQNNGNDAVQGDSRPPILVYDFLLVINTNYLPSCTVSEIIIAVDRSEIAILGYPSCVELPLQTGSHGTISVKFSVDVNGWPRYLMPSKYCRKFEPPE